MDCGLYDVRDELLAAEGAIEDADILESSGGDEATMLAYAQRARRHWERARRMLDDVIAGFESRREALRQDADSDAVTTVERTCLGGPADGQRLRVIDRGPVRIWSAKHDGRGIATCTEPNGLPDFPEGSAVEGYYDVAPHRPRAIWVAVRSPTKDTPLC